MFTVFPDTGVQKIQENDVQDIDVLSLLTVDKVYVDAGDTVSTKIKSSVSGRVKKIYAAKGDGVTDVMQEDGALALISLDGKMAVEITAASEHLSGAFCVAMHMMIQWIIFACCVYPRDMQKNVTCSECKKNKKKD